MFTRFIIIWVLILPFLSTEEANCNCYCDLDKISNRLQLDCTQFSRNSALCCEESEDIDDGKELDFNPGSVVYLSTAGSNISKFDFEVLRNFTSLRELNLSASGLSEIIWQKDLNLSKIEELDLSNNRLEDVKKDFFVAMENLKRIGLAGNHWDCRLLHWFVDWVRPEEKRGLNVTDKNEMICYYDADFGIDSIKDTMSAKQRKPLPVWEIVNNCPENCSCTSEAEFKKVATTVDCKDRGLTDFPTKLPNRTRLLHLENNQIKDFRTFIQLSIYHGITKLYLDNNHITSTTLSQLDGLSRHHRLVFLQLRNNRLTELPTHVMSKFQTLELSGNPWRCDCNSAVALQKFVVDKPTRISDKEDMMCAPDDPKHGKKQIIRLQYSDLCVEDENGFHYLDLVNGLLAVSIVLVCVKFFYDYWRFKKTGQLPEGPITIFKRWQEKRIRLSTEEN